MKKISLFLAVFLFSGIANAEIITSKSLYNFAKSRDYAALQKFSRLINVVNNGDTAVCLAIKNNDVEAYNLLLRYGANSRPECYSYAIKYRKAVLNGKPIPAISSKGSGFLGMSTTGWAIIGGALAGGGVAAAAGGGGGGGSSGDDESGESSNEGVVEDFVKNCINGKQEGGECICDDGWTGDLCNRPAVCPYNTISCKEGYEKTGKVCKSGETLYQECKPVKVPDGYTMIPCGDGYKIQDEMKSGSNTYYLCERETCSDKGYKIDCGPGYDASAACVEGSTQYYSCTAKPLPDDSYTTVRCTTGYDETTFLSGETTYYKCTKKRVPEGYYENCADGYYQVGNPFISGTTSYYQCQEVDCASQGYQASCGEGYDAVRKCLSGTIPYYECTLRDCSGYQTSCGDGYDAQPSCLSGNVQYYTCSPKVCTGYQASCGAGYEETGATCKSGSDTLVECREIDCASQGYQTTCDRNEGWQETGSTCQSGDTIYRECESIPLEEGYTTTPCNGNGYIQTTKKFGGIEHYKCEAKPCEGENFKESCGENEYRTDNVCFSGDNTLYECLPYSNMSNCEEKNPTADSCLRCKNGYTGDKCEETVDCSGYQTSCEEGYDAVQKCLSGTTPYYECTLRACTGYQASCGAGYEETGATCKSGSDTLVECREIDCASQGYQTTCGTGLIGEAACLSGTTQYYRCSLPEGYNSTEACSGGYVSDGDPIEFEGVTYYKCKAREVPSGYQEARCGKGFTTDDIILSGETTYYKCNACTETDDDGNCLEIGNKATTNGNTIEINNLDDGTIVYGMKYSEDIKNAYLDGEEKRSGTIKIEKEGAGNVYGMYSDKKVYNNNEGNEGLIEITNTGTGYVYGMYSDKNVYNNTNGTNATIKIDNSGTGDVYGIYSLATISAAHNNKGGTKGVVDITNKGDGAVYGMYTPNATSWTFNNNSAGEGIININNEGDGFVYGGYGLLANNYGGDGRAEINITNVGAGNVYGIYTDGNHIFANNLGAGTGEINITNTGSGDVYGIYSEGGLSESLDGASIQINNDGDGAVYGVYTKKNVWLNEDINIDSSGGTVIGLYSNLETNPGGTNPDMSSSKRNITIKSEKGNIVSATGLYVEGYQIVKNFGTVQMANANDAIGIYLNAAQTEGLYIGNKGNVSVEANDNGYGLYLKKGKYASNDPLGTINVSGANAFGIYSNDGYVSNDGTIEVSASDVGIGLYAKDGNAVNYGTIKVTSDGGTGIGIYHEGYGGTIYNAVGAIIEVNASEAYGIYVVGGNGTVTVQNYGIISLNGNAFEGSGGGSAYGNYIYLNGSSLLNDGTMKASTMNLDRMGGTIIATENSNFEIENEITGDLTMSSDIVTTGFDDVYTTINTINAGDTSNLNLLSQSILFDASLAENNSDVNLKMKQFNEVVDNKSLADFLQNNYALKNNETFFNTLKKQETVASLNNALNELTGQKLFSRFADEDLMMMRELTFDINNKLFMNNEDHLETSGNISTFNFNGNSGSNSRYALINQNYGKYKLGLNYGFADVSSYDNDNDNRRKERMFHIGMPISYHKKGFKFITTPHVGYASGTYDRKGLNNENYDGHIEKTMFGLMNEARYPIVFDKWTIAPSAEFNVVNYATKGHEKGGTNPLNLDLQHNYSVEAGLGLYANTQRKFGQNAKLSFTGGVAMYHEFADPYKLSIGMEGMSGKFDIRDENRSNNRAVIRTGLKFTNDNLSLDANVMSYIDREYRTNATLDFKYGF